MTLLTNPWGLSFRRKITTFTQVGEYVLVQLFPSSVPSTESDCVQVQKILISCSFVSNCDLFDLSVGMGEGWGDFMALAFHFKPSDNRNKAFALAAYLVDYAPGIRHYPYSSDLRVNPTTWSFSTQPDYARSVHALGEIWCILLFVCFHQKKHSLRRAFVSL